MLKEVDQLLFPEDEAHLSQIGAYRVVEWGFTGAFQALQSQLFLRKDIKSLFKKVSTLTSLNTKLKKKVEKTKFGLERFSKESSEKLARAKEEIA
ncbi:hypothetical protein Ddye_010997 [Dipteronia dyeriana]|uniref:Uncharacterized protein n=1 Tax=Dipteronia dyeriana TaxID=168575 RepID=A0AAD9XEB0_9ROSI|nr:hypothetical protein Ddye_010997 [Dipteronia dyeriana]